jgi:hypothetical protein
LLNHRPANQNRRSRPPTGDDDTITHHILPGPENRQPTNSTLSKRGETNAEKNENSPHDLTFKISPLQLLVKSCRSS